MMPAWVPSSLGFGDVEFQGPALDDGPCNRCWKIQPTFRRYWLLFETIIIVQGISHCLDCPTRAVAAAMLLPDETLGRQTPTDWAARLISAAYKDDSIIKVRHHRSKSYGLGWTLGEITSQIGNARGSMEERLSTASWNSTTMPPGAEPAT